MARLWGRVLRQLLARRGSIVTRMMDGVALEDLRLITETRERTSLLTNEAAALHLMACVRAVRRLGGAVAEAGAYAGGSARLICEVKGDTPLHVFDAFETPRDPTRVESGAAGREIREHFGRFYAHHATVARLLADYPNVYLHAGILPQSADVVAGERFSCVHLDLDLEGGTLGALEFFFPRLVPGGIIVGDDYNLASVRSAFDAYFVDRPDTLIALPWGQVVVVRLPHS